MAKRKTPSKGDKVALERKTLQCFRTIFSSARVHDAEVRRIVKISGSQLWALSEIDRGAGMSVNDLADRMALHQTTASNLVNALTARKLIRRQRDSEDQRVARLYVTAAGKKVLARAPGPYPGLLVDALRHLDAKHLSRLSHDIAALLAVMQRPSESAAGETLLGE